MTVEYSGSYPLVDVSLAMGVGMTAIAPTIPAINAMLAGTFGLGPMALDFEARLNAALGISFSWNPTMMITAMADITAGIAMGEILPQLAINANVSLAADLQAKLMGINFLIDASLQIQLGLIDAMAELEAAMNLSVAYVVASGTTPAEVAGDIQAQLTSLLGGGTTYAITLAVSSQAEFNALATMFKH